MDPNDEMEMEDEDDEDYLRAVANSLLTRAAEKNVKSRWAEHFVRDLHRASMISMTSLEEPNDEEEIMARTRGEAEPPLSPSISDQELIKSLDDLLEKYRLSLFAACRRTRFLTILPVSQCAPRPKLVSFPRFTLIRWDP